MNPSKLGYFFLAAVIGGILAGHLSHRHLSSEGAKAVAGDFGLLSTAFLRMIKVMIAQAAGIELTFRQQFTMLLVMMITSWGVAGMPRPPIVVIGARLPISGLPPGGAALLLAIGRFVDMGSIATNVGNCLAAAVIADPAPAPARPARPVRLARPVRPIA